MSLKRGVFYTFLTQVPTALLGILTGILMTRILGDEGRGIYALLNADIALFGLLMGLGIEMGLKYFISKQEISASKIVGLAIIIGATNSVLFGLLLLANFFFQPSTELFIPQGVDGPIIHLFLFMGFLSSLVSNIISATFQGLKKFAIVNQMAVLNAVVNIIAFGTYFYYYLQSPDENHLYSVLMLFIALAAFNTFVWIARFLLESTVKPDFKIGKKLAKQVIGYSLLGYASNVLNLLNYRLDLWILHHYSTSTQVGVYSVAVGLAQFFWMIPAPISNVLQPYLNSPDEKKKLQKFRLFSRINSTLVLGGAIILGLVAPWVVPFVYGAEFTDSVLALQLLLPGIVFSCFSKIFSVMILNSGKVYLNLLATAVGLVITIVLDFLLIPKYGLYGASIATTVTYFSVFVTVYWAFLRKLRYPFANYFLFLPKDIKLLKKL
jgi:O-antigen/teichoic acid export membrane protein